MARARQPILGWRRSANSAAQLFLPLSLTIEFFLPLPPPQNHTVRPLQRRAQARRDPPGQGERIRRVSGSKARANWAASRTPIFSSSCFTTSSSRSPPPARTPPHWRRACAGRDPAGGTLVAWGRTGVGPRAADAPAPRFHPRPLAFFFLRTEGLQGERHQPILRALHAPPHNPPDPPTARTSCARP